MTPETTALLLIGYQNDYFSETGILRKVIEESATSNHALENTLALIERIRPTPTKIIHTPIIFTEDYSELDEPIGILKAIKDLQAFKAGTSGAETIPELLALGDRMVEIPGKRGLNAFSNTDLDKYLKATNVHNILLAGAVTSICIDSTGRSAFERGYNVYTLKDCTCGRTNLEQAFYCEEIFPLYAQVIDSVQAAESLVSTTANTT